MKSIILFISFIALCIDCNAQAARIPSGVYHWADVPVTKTADGEIREFMKGSTAECSLLEIHATTQPKGAAATPPHAQKDIEEFIIVTEGTMKAMIGEKSENLGNGSALLVPPLQMLSIENAGDGALTYYTLQFRSKQPMDLQRSAKAGGALMINSLTLQFKPSDIGGSIKYLQRPTAMLNELEMHMTELKPKTPSHPPHKHIDSELILMLDGHTEQFINGKNYQGTAGDMYLMNSNEMHGIKNIEDASCLYLAIRWK